MVALEQPRTQDVQSPHFLTGQTRWLAVAVLVIGPLLQVVEFLLETPASDNTVRVAWWAAHPTRTELSMAAGLLAVPFLFGAFITIVALTLGATPRLAWTAAALMTCAMVGLAAIHGYELAAYDITRSGNQAAAKAILDGNHVGIPGVVFFALFLGGAILGTLSLAAAMWRSPLVPRIVVLFTLAFAILDFLVGNGVVSHIVNLIGLSIVAVAVITAYRRQAAHSLLSRSAWW